MATHTSFHGKVLGRYSVPYFVVLLGVAAVSFGSVLINLPVFYGRIHRVRRPIILTFVSTVVLLLVTEVAVRALDPLGISHFEEASRLWSGYIADPVLVFRLPARARGLYQGVTISTNALGLRDRDLEPKQPGELRILLLGDSITFGYGVPVEETYGRKLESILTSRLGRRVRAVNAGMGGYNTVQEYALLESHLAAIEPDLVALLYLPNDIDSNDPPFDPRLQTAFHDSALPRTARIILQKSWLYRLARFRLDDPESSRMAVVDMNARGVRDSLKALAGMAALCRQKRVGFATFFYRGEQQSGSASPFFDDLFSKLSKVGDAYGFPVADTRAWWAGMDRRLFTNSVVDWHPNARGHDVLARGMADALMKQDWLLNRGQTEAH
jgi:lysophospholipase L1-like esterase